MSRISLLLALACVAALASRDAPATDGDVNAALEEYLRVKTLPGAITAEGSAPVCALLLDAHRALRDMYPGFTLDITATGSSGAPAALMAGRCDLAAMGRPMLDAETSAFKKQFGYAPERFTIARDAIVVLANRHNPTVAETDPPIPGLTLQQLDSIFGVDRKRGGERISKWGQVGLQGEWVDRTILMAGVGVTSGTTDSFWRMVLQRGRFRSTVVVQPGPGAVVNGVGAFEESLGIVSMTYRSKRTRPVPLAATDEGPYALPTLDNCLQGRYPLVRDLYVYVNRKPGQPLPDLLRETLVFLSSEDGQNVVVANGLVPIDLATSQANLKQARGE